MNALQLNSLGIYRLGSNLLSIAGLHSGLFISYFELTFSSFYKSAESPIMHIVQFASSSKIIPNAIAPPKVDAMILTQSPKDHTHPKQTFPTKASIIPTSQTKPPRPSPRLQIPLDDVPEIHTY